MRRRGTRKMMIVEEAGREKGEKRTSGMKY